MAVPAASLLATRPAGAEDRIVYDAAQLEAALSAARPGDHILLANGTYPGTFAVARDGTSTAPIVVRAATIGGATMTGRIDLDGTWTEVRGVRFTGSATKVNINNRGARVSRCLFDSITANGVISSTSTGFPQAVIDYCEFRDIVGCAIEFTVNPADAFMDITIRRNFFNGHTKAPPDEAVSVMKTAAFNQSNLLYESNLFKNCMREIGNGARGRELLSCKTGHVTVRDNTFLDCGNSRINLRQTRNCVVEGNWMNQECWIYVYGDGHVVRNNRAVGKVLELSKGDAYATDPAPLACSSDKKVGKTTVIYEGGGCVGAHSAARNCLVEDNIGGIDLGKGFAGDNVSARDITLRRNDRAATRYADGIVANTIVEKRDRPARQHGPPARRERGRAERPLIPLPAAPLRRGSLI